MLLNCVLSTTYSEITKENDLFFMFIVVILFKKCESIIIQLKHIIDVTHYRIC